MNKKYTGIGVGSSSIIMIFLVLCLTTLALLSYSSSTAGLRYAEKARDYSKSYSDAELKANTILSEIDMALIDAAKSFDYSKSVLALNNIEGVKSVLSGDSYTVSYTVPISINNSLLVELKVPLTAQKQRYVLYGWRTVSAAHNYDNGENVWDGLGF